MITNAFVEAYIYNTLKNNGKIILNNIEKTLKELLSITIIYAKMKKWSKKKMYLFFNMKNKNFLIRFYPYSQKYKN
jgi:hypothetical protein